MGLVDRALWEGRQPVWAPTSPAWAPTSRVEGSSVGGVAGTTGRGASLLDPRPSVLVAGSWVPAPQCRALGPRRRAFGAGCRVVSATGGWSVAGWCRPP
jgi:hypothetical protein